MERSKHDGGRKYKLNFKLFLDRHVGTIVNGRKNEIGVLIRVVEDKTWDEYQFIFENGFKLVIRFPFRELWIPFGVYGR